MKYSFTSSQFNFIQEQAKVEFSESIDTYDDKVVFQDMTIFVIYIGCGLNYLP